MSIRPEFDIVLPQEAGVPLTLRTATDWYKAHLTETMPTGEESEYMNKRWAFIVSELARQQGVPAGWLSWTIQQLVENEVRLKMAAEAEGGTENFGGSA